MGAPWSSPRCSVTWASPRVLWRGATCRTGSHGPGASSTDVVSRPHAPDHHQKPRDVLAYTLDGLSGAEVRVFVEKPTTKQPVQQQMEADAGLVRERSRGPPSPWDRLQQQRPGRHQRVAHVVRGLPSGRPRIDGWSHRANGVAKRISIPTSTETRLRPVHQSSRRKPQPTLGGDCHGHRCHVLRQPGHCTKTPSRGPTDTSSRAIEATEGVTPWGSVQRLCCTLMDSTRPAASRTSRSSEQSGPPWCVDQTYGGRGDNNHRLTPDTGVSAPCRSPPPRTHPEFLFFLTKRNPDPPVAAMVVGRRDCGLLR